MPVSRFQPPAGEGKVGRPGGSAPAGASSKSKIKNHQLEIINRIQGFWIDE